MITKHKPLAPLPWNIMGTCATDFLVDRDGNAVQLYGEGSVRNLKFIAEAANMVWLARRVKESKRERNKVG